MPVAVVTVFPCASRTVARRKRVLPAASTVVSSAPEASTGCSRTVATAPGEIEKGDDVALNAPWLAVSTLLLPAASTLRPVKVATPLTASMLVVPERVPWPEPSARVTGHDAPAHPVTTLPWASSTATVIVPRLAPADALAGG